MSLNTLRYCVLADLWEAGKVGAVGSSSRAKRTHKTRIRIGSEDRNDQHCEQYPDSGRKLETQ